MEVDAEKEADAAEVPPAAEAEGEAPSTGKKEKKPRKAAAAPAEAPVVEGKRQRKSVDFFAPDVPAREKKEKPKEVRAA